jgi:hypothetical protein
MIFGLRNHTPDGLGNVYPFRTALNRICDLLGNSFDPDFNAYQVKLFRSHNDHLLASAWTRQPSNNPTDEDIEDAMEDTMEDEELEHFDYNPRDIGVEEITHAWLVFKRVDNKTEKNLCVYSHGFDSTKALRLLGTRQDDVYYACAFDSKEEAEDWLHRDFMYTEEECLKMEEENKKRNKKRVDQPPIVVASRNHPDTGHGAAYQFHDGINSITTMTAAMAAEDDPDDIAHEIRFFSARLANKKIIEWACSECVPDFEEPSKWNNPDCLPGSIKMRWLVFKPLTKKTKHSTPLVVHSRNLDQRMVLDLLGVAAKDVYLALAFNDVESAKKWAAT